MKKVNWNKVTSRKLAEDSFWKAHEGDAISDKFVTDELVKRFSLPPEKNVFRTTSTKPLLIVNLREAQNLLISKRVMYKDTSYEDIRRYVLDCFGLMLQNDSIVALIKCWPQPVDVKKLMELKKENTELTEPEDFIDCLCNIERMVPRLNCIQMSSHFNETIADLDQNINIATAACNELLKSHTFRDVLLIIRTVGNIMNSGSNYEAIAFELPILNHLHENISTDRTQTLLDFVIETISKEKSHLLAFIEELNHIGEASELRACSRI